MEVKKLSVVDLEDKKLTNYLIGLVIVIATFYATLEFGTREVVERVYDNFSDIFDDNTEIVSTTMEQPLPPPPPAVTKSISDELILVDDDSQEENNMISSEDLGAAVVAPAPKVVEVAKVPDEVIEDNEIFKIVEKMPEFPGGMAACLKFLANNIKYPTISQEHGVQGKVVIQFVVNKDGSIVDPTVVRSVDPYLDKEALRVISMMPRWTPGMQRGKPVRVKYTVPVTFRLQ
ncbi:MAG: energy transducer TonB [Bacteroidaceae bacterium]|nr:energy transducer TonB [Bacteroidaceae bacterium]MBR5763161.1 energy transducer TonB [Bacteroidaceae bacterium]